MKYLKLPKTTLENVNRAAWERKLGRPKNPDDVTEFLCTMVEDAEGNCELCVCPDEEQWFTGTRIAQMTDTPQVTRPE